MRTAPDFEIKAKGYDPEFDVLVPAIFNKVIRRLLRSLESEGRCVTPSLVHGDLWYAISGVDADTGEPLIFDACCFYAHNECEHCALNIDATSCSRLPIETHLQMNLANGCLSATDLGLRTLPPIMKLYQFRRQKKTYRGGWICISCEFGIYTCNVDIFGGSPSLIADKKLIILYSVGLIHTCPPYSKTTRYFASSKC